MNIDRRRLRRWRAIAAIAGAGLALPSAREARAEAPPPVIDSGSGSTSRSSSVEPEPRCHRDEDLACTLVRETSGGVWVWTERFRSSEPHDSGWTLAVGAGPITAAPTVRFVAATAPAGRATPNGAPILQ